MENQEQPNSIDEISPWSNLKPDTKKKKLIAATIIVVALFFSWYFVSKTSGEIAELSLATTASITTVTAGQNFDIDVNLDTKNNNVIGIKAVITYNPAEFTLQNINTNDSIFALNNTCVYANRFCEIVSLDPSNGKVVITAAKPTPGVNSASGHIARLTFRALKAFTPSASNIKIDYSNFGDYNDSDVIFDDEFGTDILSKQSVNDLTISSVLPVPTDFVATADSATSINLTWTNSVGAFGISGYNIYQDSTLLETVGTNSYQVTGLSPATLYGSYRVAAIDGSGNESAKTSGQSVTTLADTTAPSVPGSINASANMSEINLTWATSTDNVVVTGYNIYRNDNLVGTSAITSFTDEGLVPETNYDYQLEAYDAAGNKSTKSTAVSFTTTPDTAKPTIPANVSATAVSISQINLSWSVSTDNVGVVGYKIFRDGNEIDTATSSNYQDTSLTPNTTYAYTVSAYDAKNNTSNQSSSASATTGNIPASIQVTSPNDGEVYEVGQTRQITWNATGVFHVKIYIYDDRVDGSGSTNYLTPDNASVLATAGQYDWEIKANQLPTPPNGFGQDHYKIRLDGLANNGDVLVSDLSDDYFTINTPAENNHPFINPIPNQSVNEGENLTFNISATDEDGDAITFTVTNSPAGATFTDNGNNTATFNWTPGYDQAALYAPRFTASDGKDTAMREPEITVINVKKYGILNFSSLVDKWLQPDTNTDSLADAFEDNFVNTRDLGVMMSNWE
jgi:chitodextrinase